MDKGHGYSTSYHAAQFEEWGGVDGMGWQGMRIKGLVGGRTGWMDGLGWAGIGQLVWNFFYLGRKGGEEGGGGGGEGVRGGIVFCCWWIYYNWEGI